MSSSRSAGMGNSFTRAGSPGEVVGTDQFKRTPGGDARGLLLKPEPIHCALDHLPLPCGRRRRAEPTGRSREQTLRAEVLLRLLAGLQPNPSGRGEPELPRVGADEHCLVPNKLHRRVFHHATVAAADE
jgi:hypothetical protein